MDVFISWSGSRSKQIAKILYEWLPLVIQAVNPWMSSKDVPSGAVWFSEVYGKLEAGKFGILCVTPENRSAPWLLFEAGALAKGMPKNRVAPLLMGLKKEQVDGPLSAFQMLEISSDEEVHGLLRSINESLESNRLDPSTLLTSFEMWWPMLLSKLEEVPTAPPDAAQPKRSSEEIQSETLSLVREQSARLISIEQQLSGERQLVGYSGLFGNTPSSGFTLSTPVVLMHDRKGLLSNPFRQALEKLGEEIETPEQEVQEPKGPSKAK